MNGRKPEIKTERNTRMETDITANRAARKETDITVERAVALIRSSAGPVAAERVCAAEAQGRILAEDVFAPMDQPPWPRSPLDGYALRAADSVGAGAAHPAELYVAGTVYAGGWPERALEPGQALRLTTGAPLPLGCDCVIRQEDTACVERAGKEVVRIFRELRPWQNYCFQGEDFHTGDLLLPAGTVLDGYALGVLAAAGRFRRETELTVYRRLRCALICTGEELAEHDVPVLPRGKIYSSNAVLISARLRELGMHVTLLRERFADDGPLLAETLREACLSSDAVFTTGGVSVGARDILHEALALLGAERLFWKVRLKPGSPLMYSLYQGIPILSMSGNPFAAAATFELFGRPLLAVRAGSEALLPRRATAVLDRVFRKTGGRRFVRGVCRDGRVYLPEGHSSGMLRSAAGTNCLAEIPAGVAPLPAGSTVNVYLL